MVVKKVEHKVKTKNKLLGGKEVKETTEVKVGKPLHKDVKVTKTKKIIKE